MNFTLACDLMMDLEGSNRPAIYLASELIARGHQVSVISPFMSDAVEERLGADGVTPVNLHAQLAVKNSGVSLLWLETWAREAFLGLNSRHVVNDSSITLNFSQVISLPCLVWYLQGPPSRALRDMERELSTGFRIAYNVLRGAIDYADERLVGRMGRVSVSVVANSKFCASMYSNFGVRVHDVIYPPINCGEFRPSTSNPSGDYVLTYFGKETKFSVVRRVADMGVEIKAFGSKTPYIERDLIKHPNIESLGRVTTNELVDLYSNALFTIFPFTHEPFGYIPLESMACGTPSLTYDVQGPSEYVANDHTGWLVHTDDKLVHKAAELWKKGYPSRMRLNSVRTALKFDKRFYLDKWLRALSGLRVDIASNERRVKSELLTDSAPDVPLSMEDTWQSPRRNV